MPKAYVLGDMMKKYRYVLLLAVATAVIAPVAMADTFNFTYKDGGVSATGVLYVTQIASNEFGITGGTISLTDGKISGTGTILPDPNGVGNLYSPGLPIFVDNLLFPNRNPELDVLGFSFELNGDLLGSIWGDSKRLGYGIYQEDAGFFQNLDTLAGGSFATSDFVVTPEPSSLLLLGTGLLALALAFRKVKIRPNQIGVTRAA